MAVRSNGLAIRDRRQCVALPVQLGVDLAATPADQVDMVLAREHWTRAAWAHVDQVYRDRFAREPPLRAAFQAALATERARRGQRG